MSRRSFLGVCLVILFLNSFSQNYTNYSELTSASPKEGDWFGKSFDFSEIELAVGSRSGVEIFQRDSFYNWNSKQKIDTFNPDRVYLLDDLLLLCSPESFGNRSVVIYKKDSNGFFSKKQILKRSVFSFRSTGFGTTIAKKGDFLAIGAPGMELTNSPYLGAGLVYIYKLDSILDSWNEYAVLSNTNAYNEEYFGHKVTIIEDKLYVGCLSCIYTENKDTTLSVGALFIYEQDNLGNWVEKQKVLPKDKKKYRYFTFDMAISNSTLASFNPGPTQRSFNIEFFKFGKNGFQHAQTVLVDEWEGRFRSLAFESDKLYMSVRPSTSVNSVFEYSKNGASQWYQSLTTDYDVKEGRYDLGEGLLVDGETLMFGNSSSTFVTDDSRNLEYSGSIVIAGPCRYTTRIDSGFCDNFNWNGNEIKETGTYLKKFKSQTGCDSFVYLTATGNTFSTISDTICGSYYEAPSGKTISQTGIYSDTLSSLVGCDSVIALDILVDDGITYIEDFISSCEPITVNSNRYTESGRYVDTIFSNTKVCDTVRVTYLTLDNVNTNFYRDGSFLKAQAKGTAYQWLDCDNNYAIIPNKTGREIEVDQNNEVAVEVTENGCTDTSDCFDLRTLAIGNQFAQNASLELYPNPASSRLFLKSHGAVIKRIVLMNSIGKQVQKFELDSSVASLDIAAVNTGIYTCKIELSNGKHIERRVVFYR